MLKTSPMRYLKIFLLEKDFPVLIDKLADYGWMEIQNPQNQSPTGRFEQSEAQIIDTARKSEEIFHFLQQPYPKENGSLLPIDTICQDISNQYDHLIPYRDEEASLIEKKRELGTTLKELENYKNLPITSQELESLSFLHYTIGFLSSTDQKLINEKMGNRILLYPINDNNLFLIFTSKKGRWTMESELKKTGFKKKELTLEQSIEPSELFKKINHEYSVLEKRLSEIQIIKANYLLENGPRLTTLTTSLNLQRIYHGVFEKIEHSRQATAVEGWIQEQKLPELSKGLEKLLGGRISIISYHPDELEEVKSGKWKVPVYLQNKGIFKAFERLIYGYGAPVYGTIDPTIFVTISFLLLFGLMFGDIGQGFVIMSTGLATRFLKPLEKFKFASPILISVGIVSMIFGYVYGAIFCYEHVEWIFTPVNKMLFQLDRPYLLDTSAGNIQNIFLITITFGIFINLTGMLINLVNNLLRHKKGEALFSRTGFAGFLFLASGALVVYQSMLWKLTPWTFLFWIAGISAVLIMCKEPLSHIIDQKRPIFHHGIGMWLIHSLVEAIELVLSNMSNNLSFIRVGAFAFAHVLLSHTITLLLRSSL